MRMLAGYNPNGNSPSHLQFFTLANDSEDAAQVCLMIDSLRDFGGDLANCPVWVYTTQTEELLPPDWACRGVHVKVIHVPAELRRYYFGAMVYACADAEAHAAHGATSLVWVTPGCLFLKAPLLFDLGERYDAAVRPVHIRNVGLPFGAPPDAFWRGVYAALGIDGIPLGIESFVDSQALNAYFNSHSFSVRPSLGLMKRWQSLFTNLVRDRVFQANACQDKIHKIFLFQAILSALLATAIPTQRLRLLPPDYNYPYHMQAEIPPERRTTCMESLTCLAYEDRSLDPDLIKDIAIQPSLQVWLKEHVNQVSN
jgi:hypothetical protein